jgi:uncharacterized protein YjaZ
MTITFHSPFPEAATTLFEMAYPEAVHSHTGAEDHYMFRDDTLLRDVRSWGGYAIGCGLINTFLVTVSY